MKNHRQLFKLEFLVNETVSMHIFSGIVSNRFQQQKIKYSNSGSLLIMPKDT